MMWSVAKRTLRLYFRDKTSVFFSLMAVLIIIGLYVLFLGDVVQGDMAGMPGSRYLMDSWVVAGILAVATITTAMGAFGIMVEDRSKKIIKDFTASPIKRSSLVGGYLIGTFFVGMIMTLITFVIAEIYITAYGGDLVTPGELIKIFGIMVLSVFSSAALVYFIASFIKSSNAFATVSTILGTLIGFLTGIYIPIGSLPEAVQTVVKVFPVSHAGALFRQVMMERPIAQTFAGAPASAVEGFKIQMGVVFQFGDKLTTPLFSIIVLVATALVFFVLAIFSISRKIK